MVTRHLEATHSAVAMTSDRIFRLLPVWEAQRVN
jgi:hypothetical protein